MPAPTDSKSISLQPKTARPLAPITKAAEIFKFYCPACQQKLASKIEWQGKKILCPSCRTQIPIPKPVK